MLKNVVVIVSRLVIFRRVRAKVRQQVFLNKTDQLRKRVKSGAFPVKQFFPAYEGELHATMPFYVPY